MFLSNSCGSNKVHLSLDYIGGSLPIGTIGTWVSLQTEKRHNTLSLLLKHNSNYLVSSTGKSLVRMRYTSNSFESSLIYPSGRLGQPCRNLARILTKTHNFEQNFIRLLFSTFTMLLI